MRVQVPWGTTPGWVLPGHGDAAPAPRAAPGSRLLGLCVEIGGFPEQEDRDVPVCVLGGTAA